MDLFAKNLEKPGPIPNDIFKTVGYENNLNWMIMSSQGTGNELNHVNAELVQNIQAKEVKRFVQIFVLYFKGSHPHNDPDLTGAWAFLLNGFKWWIIFPQGKITSLFLHFYPYRYRKV